MRDFTGSARSAWQAAKARYDAEADLRAARKAAAEAAAAARAADAAVAGQRLTAVLVIQARAWRGNNCLACSRGLACCCGLAFVNCLAFVCSLACPLRQPFVTRWSFRLCLNEARDSDARLESIA